MAALPLAALAQSAIDAQQISQPDFKGTARFMSMGGAFTALGGDLSSLNQNPAGIGVYRSNDVGATLNINIQSTKTTPTYFGQTGNSHSQTKVYCNNFGYVGATRLDGALKTLNWGASYNRAASFDRVYRGGAPSISTSLTNYIASFTDGVSYGDMDFGSNYNPYQASDIDWLSILAYNSYMINPLTNTTYQGLYQNGISQADAIYNVRETGYIDEYDMSFGGNVENLVYWGLSVGITDLHYTRTIYYDESLSGAAIYSNSTGITTGDAGFGLSSRKYINGTGWNLKAGVIIKPINELRIGFAVHTPTWYHLDQGYDASVDYAYTPSTVDNPATLSGSEYTDDAYFRWHFNAPWKLMAGIAGVIDGRAIISLDYQFDGYNSMRIKTPTYNNAYYEDEFESNDILNQDIKDYFKGASTVRLGLEYRVTPQFSVRAGYNYQSSFTKADAKDGNIEVLTSGTDCSYSFDKDIQNICFGLGYRYQMWYIDAAYVYTNRQSTFHAFTNSSAGTAPTWALKDHNSSIVLSTGFRF